MSEAKNGACRVLYCHCAYSNVIAPQDKKEVLRRLCEEDVAFDAVPDLCEMSARKDPALARLAGEEGDIRIAACYPRAVRWLFSNAGVEFPAERVEVLNMRKQGAEQVIEGLLAEPQAAKADADEVPPPPAPHPEPRPKRKDAPADPASKPDADRSKPQHKSENTGDEKDGGSSEEVSSNERRSNA